MAGGQPSPDDVAQVCAITEVDESSARILLRKYNNDPNAAVNAYFEDPAGALREAPAANEWQYQDNIPFADDASMGGVPAMSRPPSRVDNSRVRIDLSAEHATAVASDARTLREQEELEDPELQRAVAESMRATLPAQENGVTGAGSNFGPAKRDYYEPSNWALTTFSSSREIIDHPPPTKRRRLDDEPAFLRGSKETDYLAPLLTIYHSIPRAREALLMPSLRVHTYGHDATWWSGTSDENTKALSTDSSLLIDRDDCNLLAEVQCLMAFLDKTDRAYGSVDALADLQSVRGSRGNDNYIRFLSAWELAAQRQARDGELDNVFVSVAAKDSGLGEGIEAKPLLCIEAPANRIPGETLVDLLDRTVWDDDTGNIDNVWIEKVADVFTIRIYDPNDGKNGSLELTLDPIWYPDRYMLDCKEATQEMRKQMQLLLREMAHCTSIQRRCEILKLPDNRILMIREVLDAAAKASVEAAGRNSIPNGLVDPQRSLSSESLETTSVDSVESELQAVLERIDQKLRLLDERREELRARMRQIALHLTRPTEESPDVPHRKYILQGVSTKPTVTYVRRPNTDLLLEDEDEENTESHDWQWWRLAWIQDEIQTQQPNGAPAPTIGPVTQAQAEAKKQKQNFGFTAGLSFDNLPRLDPPALDVPKPYDVRKVTEDEVLEAVKKEHSSVILVYASEMAMNWQGSDLGIALRYFVDRDNQAFAEELFQQEGPPPDAGREADVDVEFEDVPLIDPNGSSSSARELTPMSTSSPGRDEDGQASPKRLRGENLGPGSDLPPSYEEITVTKQEMQEKKGNKIGLYAEQMMQKYGTDGQVQNDEMDDGKVTFMHVENSRQTG